MSTVRPFISRSSASITSFSDSVSSAAVGSSRMRIGALRMIARAIPIRWRWPPESVSPRSPTIVLYPSGIFAMNSSAFASFAASTISASVAVGRPYAMLSRTVPRKSTVSCRTKPIWPRSPWTVKSRRSTPSIRTRPPEGS